VQNGPKWSILCFPYLKGVKMAQKEKTPTTRYQKGRKWATATLVLTGLFSIWFNVRSGKLAPEPVLFSVMPVVVLFLTIHLITYLNPRKGWHKVLVYAGLGLVTLVAFGMSGYHLWEQAVHNGQPGLIALTYPFIVDVPSVISAVILVEKVPVAQSSANRTQPAKAAVPAKKTSPAKAATPASRPNRTSRAKAKPADSPDILADPFEKAMLTA